MICGGVSFEGEGGLGVGEVITFRSGDGDRAIATYLVGDPGLEGIEVPSEVYAKTPAPDRAVTLAAPLERDDAGLGSCAGGFL
jgi:hypothetical protein